jgi:Acylphosphatases
MAENPSRIHAIVHGRVQGVFFRAWTREQANQLGLAGWVRNLPDGSVEIIAEGPRPALEALLELCQKGPSGATVRRVAVEWPDPEDLPSGFQIIH